MPTIVEVQIAAVGDFDVTKDPFNHLETYNTYSTIMYLHDRGQDNVLKFPHYLKRICESVKTLLR